MLLARGEGRRGSDNHMLGHSPSPSFLPFFLATLLLPDDMRTENINIFHKSPALVSALPNYLSLHRQTLTTTIPTSYLGHPETDSWTTPTAAATSSAWISYGSSKASVGTTSRGYPTSVSISTSPYSLSWAPGTSSTPSASSPSSVWPSSSWTETGGSSAPLTTAPWTSWESTPSQSPTSSPGWNSTPTTDYTSPGPASSTPAGWPPSLIWSTPEHWTNPSFFPSTGSDFPTGHGSGTGSSPTWTGTHKTSATAPTSWGTASWPTAGSSSWSSVPTEWSSTAPVSTATPASSTTPATPSYSSHGWTSKATSSTSYVISTPSSIPASSTTPYSSASETWPTSVWPTSSVPAWSSPVYPTSPIYSSSPVHSSTPVYSSVPAYSSSPVYLSSPIHSPSPISSSSAVHSSTPAYPSSPVYSSSASSPAVPTWSTHKAPTYSVSTPTPSPTPSSSTKETWSWPTTPATPSTTPATTWTTETSQPIISSASYPLSFSSLPSYSSKKSTVSSVAPVTTTPLSTPGGYPYSDVPYPTSAVESGWPTGEGKPTETPYKTHHFERLGWWTG